MISFDINIIDTKNTIARAAAGCKTGFTTWGNKLYTY